MVISIIEGKISSHVYLFRNFNRFQEIVFESEKFFKRFLEKYLNGFLTLILKRIVQILT